MGHFWFDSLQPLSQWGICIQLFIKSGICLGNCRITYGPEQLSQFPVGQTGVFLQKVNRRVPYLAAIFKKLIFGDCVVATQCRKNLFSAKNSLNLPPMGNFIPGDWTPFELVQDLFDEFGRSERSHNAGLAQANQLNVLIKSRVALCDGYVMTIWPMSAKDISALLNRTWCILTENMIVFSSETVAATWQGGDAGLQVLGWQARTRQKKFRGSNGRYCPGLDWRALKVVASWWNVLYHAGHKLEQSIQLNTSYWPLCRAGRPWGGVFVLTLTMNLPHKHQPFHYKAIWVVHGYPEWSWNSHSRR